MSTHVATTDAHRDRWCLECGVQWPCQAAVQEAFPGDEARQERFRQAAERFHCQRAMGTSYIGDGHGDGHGDYETSRTYSSRGRASYTHLLTRRVTFADGTTVLIASKRQYQESDADPVVGRAKLISPL